MKKIIILAASMISASPCLAGSVGGVNPPAIKDAEMVMMSQPALDGALFLDEGGAVGLLSRRTLETEIVAVAPGEGPGEESLDGGTEGTTQALTLSPEDLSALQEGIKRVSAIGRDGRAVPFAVIPGRTEGTVILRDIRLSSPTPAE